MQHKDFCKVCNYDKFPKIVGNDASIKISTAMYVKVRPEDSFNCKTGGFLLLKIPMWT